MSRTGEDYSNHMYKGGWEECAAGCPAAKRETMSLELALKLAQEAGYTVTPSTTEN